MEFNRGYFFQILPHIASKLNVILTLTVVSAVFSPVIGMVFTIISYYKIEGMNQVLRVWVSFVRGIPVAAQLFSFYYDLADLNSLILNMSPTAAVTVIIGLDIGAFVSESIRGALIPVDEGQREAAMAFGITGSQMTIRVVIPQAIRVTLPLLFNNLINLFKMPSLVFLVGVRDMMGAIKIEGANTFQFFGCYARVMLIYWVITLILTAIQKVLEKRCNAIF